jgi:hypothetical protein
LIIISGSHDHAKRRNSIIRSKVVAMVIYLKIIVYFIEGYLRLVLAMGCLLLSLKGSLKSVTPKPRSSEIKTICKLRFGLRNNYEL